MKLVTVVTGGGRGIGRAIAVRMAVETAVLVVGRTESDLVSVCEEINADGGEADYVVGDVAEPATAQAAIEKAKSRGWTIRNLAANAGIANGGAIETVKFDVFREMFEVNVYGTFNFVKACIPEMVAGGGGTIVVISSVLGLNGRKYDSVYSATKFAQVGLAQSVADEHAKHRIVSVPICPGFVDTDMTRRTINGVVKHKGISVEEAKALVASKNPQGRILQPEEIGEAVAYCCSGASSVKSGEPMRLTGVSEPRVLQLVNWIHHFAAPAKKLLLPISGGSDSALCFALCALAYPGKTIGVYVGSKRTLRCRKWFESIGKVMYIPKRKLLNNDEIGRWATFLRMAHDEQAWLVCSRNHTEEVTGLFSLVSRIGTFMPLSSVWKSEVMELCDLIGVPAEVTASSRRADPDCGRPVEMAEIQLELIDVYLQVHEGLLPESELSKLTTEQCEYLARVVQQNEFKRFLPSRGPSLFASKGT